MARNNAAWRWTGADRPGDTITAAPLRDGTYHPRSVSPSAVVNATSSRWRAEFGAGTAALEAWVATYPNAIG